MATQIKLRRDTSTNWISSNPVLELGEPGYETNTGKLKIGNGSSAWNNLEYFNNQPPELTSFAGHIIPSADNTYDLGSPTKQWRHAFIAEGSLYIGDIKLTNNAGQLVVQQVTNPGLITEAPLIDTPGVVTTDRIVNGVNTFAITSSGALELNGDPFTGGSGSGDRLTNGLNEAVLNSDGSITLPTLSTVNWEATTLTGPTLQMGNDPTVSEVVITGPTPTNTNPSAKRFIIQGQQGFGGENNNKGAGSNVYIWAGLGGEGGSIDPRGNGGNVEIRSGLGGANGGDILIESGAAQSENGNGGSLDLYAGSANNINGFGGSVNISAGYGAGVNQSGNINVYTNIGNWQFKEDGSFAINNNEVHIATNNWGITASVNVNTVVYTAKQSNLASIRVHATLEGQEDGGDGWNHTQACDMMIIRRQVETVSTVDSVVYGVIYTGTGPLATLDAQWNAVTSKIEITAIPTSTTNNVYVKVYATEVARGD